MIYLCVCMCVFMLQQGDFTWRQSESLFSDRQHVLHVHGNDPAQLQTLENTHTHHKHIETLNMSEMHRETMHNINTINTTL